MRAGFIPANRRAAFDAIKNLKATQCPFVNLPEKEAGRWGQGFTAAKMKEAVWIKPEAVAQIEFLEWTDANHLRHTKFVGLRDDKERGASPPQPIMAAVPALSPSPARNRPRNEVSW